MNKIAEPILKRALKEGHINSIPENSKVQAALAARLIAEGKIEQSENSERTEDKDEQFYLETLQAEIESGLPIPHEIEGDPPDLPVDLTTLSDKEIRFLHGAFNACAARAGWLYSFEETGRSAAKQIADHLEDEYITSLGDERKDFGGKPKSQALLKAEAKTENPDIVKWRKRESQHAIAANKYQKILEIYDNNCTRLSRDWTMRMDEREHS